MKTKKEIEQLSEFKYQHFTNKATQNHFKLGFYDGYTQCQEDMKKDIEYWQGEFDHWHQQAMEMSNKYNELLNKQD